MLNFKLAACKHVHSEKWLGGDNKPILSKGEGTLQLHSHSYVVYMLTFVQACVF